MSNRLDVHVETAGSLLWLAPHGLGGHTPDELGQAWMGTPKNGVDTATLIAKNLFAPFVLMQGDDYIVRWVVGELSPEEQGEWMARARAKLSVACGKLMCAGVLTPDFAQFEYPTIGEAEPGQSSQFGHYIRVAPGDYDVTVYSYPPRELTGAWDAMEDPKTYGRHPAMEPEKPKKYFERTRPGTELPAWLEDPSDETPYVQFVIHVRPSSGDVPPVELDEAGGVPWEFRKPKLCPLGLRAEIEGE